jgi:transposase
LLFQDEARFGCINDRRRCWAPPPCRPRVHQQIVRQFVYGLVAVSPRDGQLASLVLPWVDTQTMSLFLAHTAACFRDQHCLLLLDGAGWHRARDLRVPPTLHLLFLPPYSPELNPVEQIWKHLREHFFRNQAFDSLDLVIDRLCEGLSHLHQNPTIVQPMTCYDWLKTLPVM